MPERMERIEEPKTKDPTKIAEQTLNTLHEMERALASLQADIAHLGGRSMGGPLGGAGPSLFASPYGPATMSPLGYGATPGLEFAMSPYAAPSGLPLGGATGLTGGLASFEPRRARDLKNLPPTPRLPACDVVNEEREVVIRLEVPGVRKENLDVLITGQAVTIEATTKPESEEGIVLLNERGPVVYRRSVPLPVEVQAGQSKANLKDGVLTLRLAKKEPGEGPRHLDVAYG